MWPRLATIFADDGTPKVHRRYLFGTGKTFGVFLHNFVGGDAPTVFHDHPWTWGLAVVLRGGYIEERCDRDGTSLTRRRLGPGCINLLLPGVFHRVELCDGRPAWTLFIHGRKIRRWGFLESVTGAFEFWSPSDPRCP